MSNNGYFLNTDPYIWEIGGESIRQFWSRPHEYQWAMEKLKGYNPKKRVADMGSGWMPRAFRDKWLAKRFDTIYAIDKDERLLSCPMPDNIVRYIADLQEMPASWVARFDAILCISVLEDILGIEAVLREFDKCLAPGGRVFLTFDTPHDLSKPCPVYPGLELDRFYMALNTTNLEFDGGFPEQDMSARVFHAEWNLSVFHCVLKHR